MRRRTGLAALTLQRDPATAASELAQVVELDGNDAVLHSEYGDVLLGVGKPAEAGSGAGGVSKFVARAPRSAVMLSTAEGRISALAPR